MELIDRFSKDNATSYENAKCHHPFLDLRADRAASHCHRVVLAKST